MIRQLRRSAVLVAVACLAALGLLAVPTFASAAPAAAAPVKCVGAGYPPNPHATILVSTTTPLLNATIEVSGTAFCGNETVRLTLQGSFVGTAHTDATGSFDPPVKITKGGSNVQLCGIGASGLAGDRDCVALNTNAGGSGAGGNGAGGNGGGTAFTGTDIALLCLIAAVLLAAGGAAVAAGRRRRQQPVA